MSTAGTTIISTLGIAVSSTAISIAEVTSKVVNSVAIKKLYLQEPLTLVLIQGRNLTRQALDCRQLQNQKTTTVSITLEDKNNASHMSDQESKYAHLHGWSAREAKREVAHSLVYT